MCRSCALALICLIGRPSLAVINVMLFPAAAIERSRFSSSSVHKRKLRLIMASVFRPSEAKRQFRDDGCGLRAVLKT
jgi:hypothetical protein